MSVLKKSPRMQYNIIVQLSTTTYDYKTDTLFFSFCFFFRGCTRTWKTCRTLSVPRTNSIQKWACGRVTADRVYILVVHDTLVSGYRNEAEFPDSVGSRRYYVDARRGRYRMTKRGGDPGGVKYNVNDLRRLSVSLPP